MGEKSKPPTISPPRHWEDLLEDYMKYGSPHIGIDPATGRLRGQKKPTDRVDQLTEAVAELTKIVVRLNKRIDDLENSR